MNQSIQDLARTLEAASGDGAASHAVEIERFLSSNTFPIVGETGATFVYRGQADEVHLQHWIYGLASSQPFQRLADTDLWHLFVELPKRSRVEYKIDVVSGESHRWVQDPFNPIVAHDPFGANSVCQGFGYSRPDWTLEDPETRPGRLVDVSLPSRALGSHRGVKVYLPARFRPSREYPLLVIHDGEDFLRFASLKTVLDNLIHRLEIAPFIAVLTQSSDRLVEYGASRRHARFLGEELVPFMEDRYPLLSDPASRGLMGASFGAVASLFTAWNYPGQFGRLLLQSGSFAFTDIGRNRRGPAFDPVVAFVNALRERPRVLSERIFMSCGIYESLIYENRSLAPLLRDHGMEVRFEESRDGHNWENWRDRLRSGLSWLFHGPLWMVYE